MLPEKAPSRRWHLVCPNPSCTKSAAHCSTRKFGDSSGARVNEIRLLRENAQRLNVGHWLRNPWRTCETYKHVLLGQGGTLPLTKQKMARLHAYQEVAWAAWPLTDYVQIQCRSVLDKSCEATSTNDNGRCVSR